MLVKLSLVSLIGLQRKASFVSETLLFNLAVSIATRLDSLKNFTYRLMSIENTLFEIFVYKDLTVRIETIHTFSVRIRLLGLPMNLTV